MFLPALSACGGAPSSTGDSNHGLYINSALGVSLIQSPITTGFTPESAVKGLVFVSRDNVQGQKVAATLTVNGVEVPRDAFLEAFDLAKASLPNATAGGTLTLHAAFESYSADLVLHCPSEVSITAPADQTQAMIGDAMSVRWNGTIDYGSAVKPDIMVHGFDPASGERSDLGFPDRVETGKSSDAFALPDPKGAPQWIVDLYVPGIAVSDAAGIGFCMLDRRVHLLKK
jgi:hypothetical protein